jgi:hypothetical protein
LGHFPDRGGDAGVAVVEFGDQGADEVGGERGGDRQAEVSAGQIGDVVDGAFAGGEFAQGSAGVREVGASGVGEPDRAAAAVE